jgi:hypothetical protein
VNAQQAIEPQPAPSSMVVATREATSTTMSLRTDQPSSWHAAESTPMSLMIVSASSNSPTDLIPPMPHHAAGQDH